MNRVLILLNYGYPYGTAAETFLEPEIKYLSNAFDQIYIYTIKNEETQQRQTPENVFLQKISTDYTTLFKFYIIIKFIFNINFYRELFNIIFLYKRGITYQKLAILFNHFIDGYNIYNKVRKNIILNQLHLNQMSIYSLWLSETAIAAALLKKQFPKTKVFARAHRFDLYFEVHEVRYLPLRYYLLNSLDKLFFISEQGMEYFENLLQIRKTSKLLLSRLGTENSYVLKPFASNNTLKIVSCSYVMYNKRVELIAEALSVSNMEIEWVHIGNGWNNPDYDPIIKKINALLKNKINIKCKFTGHLSNISIFEYYHNNTFDLFINLSKSEGIPLSIMEAMSFGIPSIGTNVGGVSEIIEDGVNGYLLSSDPHPKEVTDKISLFHSLSPDHIKEMRENAYKTWKEKFNAEINYPNFIESLSEL